MKIFIHPPKIFLHLKRAYYRGRKRCGPSGKGAADSKSEIANATSASNGLPVVHYLEVTGRPNIGWQPTVVRSYHLVARRKLGRNAMHRDRDAGASF